MQEIRRTGPGILFLVPNVPPSCVVLEEEALTFQSVAFTESICACSMGPALGTPGPARGCLFLCAQKPSRISWPS